MRIFKYKPLHLIINYVFKQLNHPNVVRYLHSFVENRELQIVLELADAGDLGQLLRHCQRRHQLLIEVKSW